MTKFFPRQEKSSMPMKILHLSLLSLPLAWTVDSRGSQEEWFLPPGDIWWYLEIFWMITIGEEETTGI